MRTWSNWLRGAVVIMISVMLAGSADFASAEPIEGLSSRTQLVGMYENGLERFLIRERAGNLELIYDTETRPDSVFSTYSSFPLVARAVNSYRLLSYGPLAKQAVTVVFERDRSERGVALVIGATKFNRKFFDVEEGKTFQIKPLLTTTELRQKALAALPPPEQGIFIEPELLEVVTLDPTIKLDIRYAGTNNFMGIQLYDEPRAFLQRSAAEALVRVNGLLKKYGYGLIVYDAYRPWYVTKMFWDATPDRQKMFVADPAKGSRHNRGCAVDLGFYDLTTGEPVDMGSDFDEFSIRAYPTFPGGTSEQRFRRELLQTLMAAENFTVYPEEWWHFDFFNWRKYPILNLKFDEL